MCSSPDGVHVLRQDDKTHRLPATEEARAEGLLARVLCQLAPTRLRTS